MLMESKKPEFLEALPASIVARAYSRFEQSGWIAGNDVSNWLEAEREVSTVAPDIRDLGPSFSAKVSSRHTPGSGLEVCALDERAIILANSDARVSDEAEARTYNVIRWPELIDSASCNAEAAGGELIVTARTERRAGVPAGDDQT
jgi:hypothetical protein